MGCRLVETGLAERGVEFLTHCSASLTEAPSRASGSGCLLLPENRPVSVPHTGPWASVVLLWFESGSQWPILKARPMTRAQLGRDFVCP